MLYQVLESMFESSPDAVNRVRDVMAFLETYVDHSQDLCHDHLLCARPSVLTAAAANVAHRALIGALVWRSHNELLALVQCSQVEITHIRFVYYGLHSMLYMANKHSEFRSLRPFLVEFESIWVKLYTEDDVPVQAQDLVESFIEWDEDYYMFSEQMLCDIVTGFHIGPKRPTKSKSVKDLQQQVRDLKASTTRQKTQITKLKKALALSTTE